MPVLWWMRALLATGIAAALAALAGGAQAREASIYRGKCGEVVLPSGPTSVASSLGIRTACGTFAIDGRGVRYTGPDRAGWKYDGLTTRRGRIFLYEKGRILWRSRGRRHGVASWYFRDGRTLSFLPYGGRLHIAEIDGRERPVGFRDEYPLGWTRAGLLVTSQGHVLRARTRSGRLVRVFEERAGTRSFDPSLRTLIYVSGSGALIRTDGRRSETLVSRGLRRWIGIWTLEGGRVALTDRRLTLLRADGSFLASDGLPGNLAGIEVGDEIVTVSTGPLDSRSRAPEWVRLLRAGDRASTLLHSASVGALGCGHWPTLAWRGDELLYSTSEGHVVVMKPSSEKKLDLTAVVKRLPGEFLEARWS
jgi:hypothetical protein